MLEEGTYKYLPVYSLETQHFHTIKVVSVFDVYEGEVNLQEDKQTIRWCIRCLDRTLSPAPSYLAFYSPASVGL